MPVSRLERVVLVEESVIDGEADSRTRIRVEKQEASRRKRQQKAPRDRLHICIPDSTSLGVSHTHTTRNGLGLWVQHATHRPTLAYDNCRRSRSYTHG